MLRVAGCPLNGQKWTLGRGRNVVSFSVHRLLADEPGTKNLGPLILRCQVSRIKVVHEKPGVLGDGDSLGLTFGNQLFYLGFLFSGAIIMIIIKHCVLFS